ncbi:MAG: glycosyltransferase [Magnetococcales bacterium]|nr:glycosyltransferase [Magnetococcales bacterium]
MTTPTLPKILFVTPRFLFPLDTGGQIRSAKILRAAQGTLLDITLVAPATADQVRTHAHELQNVCSRFLPYPPRWSHPWHRWLGRALALFGNLPISVASDLSNPLRQLLAQERRSQTYAAEVCDFLHQAVNYPTLPGPMPFVLFTHNVEQEIFRRRLEVAKTGWQRWLWRNQYQKMARLESHLVGRFHRILTVSERDRQFFLTNTRHPDVRMIPTGVDWDELPWHPPAPTREMVFMGSMDAHQNVEGVRWFLEAIWPIVAQQVGNARVRIIGRYPPAALVSAYQADKRIEFTGWVADVAAAARTGQVFIVPLRVGSGTRIKIYEAMALGLPVVSTTIGAEGLELLPGKHFLQADRPEEFAAALVALLNDHETCVTLSKEARLQVESCCGWQQAAQVLARACGIT